VIPEREEKDLRCPVGVFRNTGQSSYIYTGAGHSGTHQQSHHFGRLRQEDFEFEASLGYTASLRPA
jgi:hypothetical protein